MIEGVAKPMPMNLVQSCVQFFADKFAMKSVVAPTVMLFTAFARRCVVGIVDREA
jgi:hypothetical protein